MSQTLSTQPGTSILQPWTGPQLQANAQAGALIRQQGTRFPQQQIAQLSPAITYGVPTVVNVPIQNVGLITKFYAEVLVNITNPAGAAQSLTRSTLAPFNLLGTIAYTDPNSNQRINTTGWHLAAVTARRHRRVPGASLTTDTPSGFGSVLAPMQAIASIPAGATGFVRCIYEIPLAFSKNSFQGAVFAGAVFATQSLQLTLPGGLVGAVGADDLGCVYKGADPAHPPTFTSTVTVWQDYWDGFPLQYLNALSPDLSTVYELKTTGYSALAANLDNFFRFSNLRSFMSATVYFDQAGALNAGSDINYFALLSANQTTIFKRDAQLQSYLTRQTFQDDFPPQMYMFDFSEAPINTAAEGNTVLSMNPSSVAAGAVAMVGWEDLATQAVLASAPSLSGNLGVGG